MDVRACQFGHFRATVETNDKKLLFYLKISDVLHFLVFFKHHDYLV